MKHSGHIVEHSTIIKGIRKANNLMEDDNDYKRIITTIEESILDNNAV
jgi:chromosomal replication initiation ATPase DnaA